MATEKRLIDVNKVIHEMQKCIDESPYTRDSIASYTFGAIIECLKKEPTVDAVEVKHGRWIFPTKINGRTFNIPHCSVCNGVPPGVSEHTKYCSHCGAKMDGDGK